MKAGEEISANGIRYRVEAVDDVCVTYRTWSGIAWSAPRAIVRSAWIAMTSPEWVGPGHAAPGWATADGER